VRNLVVFGADGATAAQAGMQTVTVDEVAVRCAVLRRPDAAWDRDDPRNARSVFVGVRALSCNYRDRGFLYAMGRVPAARYSSIGSEFVAEVLDAGPEVHGLRPGDRVLPNHHYVGTGADAAGVREGVATNQASRERQVFPAAKLRRVPPSMPDEVAAAFSLGAQTAYSMVRKLDLAPGARVLVTAGTSNTSLFLVQALRGQGVETVVSTTSATHAPRLEALGAHVIVGERGGPTGGAAAVHAFAGDEGAFDAVLDPFYDLHLEHAVQVMAPFGRYVTCGFAGQNPALARAGGVESPRSLDAVMHAAIVKNLSIIGNCVGVAGDLDAALADYADGRMDAVVDSVFGEGEPARFFDRTFNDRGRFGKVVFRYT
jgi:NADPH:quinone reductase-like Zn-dependent oxidoreductase